MTMIFNRQIAVSDRHKTAEQNHDDRLLCYKVTTDVKGKTTLCTKSNNLEAFPETASPWNDLGERNICILSRVNRMPSMYQTRSGHVYEYGRSYAVSGAPGKYWTPLSTINKRNPPPPEDYMYGEQFKSAFVQESDETIFSRILRWILCV
jgi:hypothetical protein